MSEMRFSATVDAIGRIRFDQPELAAAELSKLAGKRVTVVVKRFRDARSNEHNAYMWAHVLTEAVAESADLVELETGSQVFRTRQDVHNFGKVNLLTRPVITNRGTLNMLGTTTDLTPAEFSEYLERLCAKLAQYGVRIPER